eukprot:1161518-Pelagomonas_calceolata.AAC.16
MQLLVWPLVPSHRMASWRAMPRPSTMAPCPHNAPDMALGSLPTQDDLMARYAKTIYNGFWFSPEREAMQALIDKTQEHCTGVCVCERMTVWVVCFNWTIRAHAPYDWGWPKACANAACPSCVPCTRSARSVRHVYRMGQPLSQPQPGWHTLRACCVHASGYRASHM